MGARRGWLKGECEEVSLKVRMQREAVERGCEKRVVK